MIIRQITDKFPIWCDDALSQEFQFHEFCVNRGKNQNFTQMPLIK